MQIQVMPEAEAAGYEINPFDVTKVCSHKSAQSTATTTAETKTTSRRQVNCFAR